jgi:2,5-diamino-6-(ribosylamino)-4(3H)-pyrimidinone 5'-phosphate reductase
MPMTGSLAQPFSMNRKEKLPFVFINVASTVDGKLAPHTRRFIPFSSRRDQQLLFELRSRADAVMSGARTVDLGLVDLGPGSAKYRRIRLQQQLPEFNLRVVVSGGATLNPEAEIFAHRFSPIIVLTTARADKRRVERLRRVADEVKVCGRDEVDFVQALRWLRDEWNVRRLLCEGGGEVNAGLFRQNVVDEVYLTLSPLIFGGRNAPTMADGEGISEVNDATRLRLKSLRRIGDELFLVYRVRKAARRLNLQPEVSSETSPKPLLPKRQAGLEE